MTFHSIGREIFAAPRAMALALMLCSLCPPWPARPDAGDDGAGFDAWLAQFKQQAAAQGISPATISRALAGVTYDPTVVRLDRSQKSFKLSFEEFYARRVGPGLMRRGQALMRQHQATLERIEKRFGVPAPILISIWGLETNYGADSQRQVLHHPLARHAVLRLPPLGVLHRPPARRTAHRRSRRPHAGADARRLGRRDRPHPVPALRLLQVRGRFRRRRPARPRAQRARHAGLHRQLPQGQRLAGGPGLGAGLGQLRRLGNGTGPRSTSAPSP